MSYNHEATAEWPAKRIKELEESNAALTANLWHLKSVRDESLQEARRDAKQLRDALAELVALKAMKDEMSHMLLREEGGMGLDYDRRKPLAWQRARELVGSNVELNGERSESARTQG